MTLLAQADKLPLPDWVVLFTVAAIASVIRANKYKSGSKVDSWMLLTSAIIGGIVGRCSSRITEMIMSSRGYNTELSILVFIAFVFGFVGVVVFESLTGPLERIILAASRRAEKTGMDKIDQYLPEQPKPDSPKNPSTTP